MLIDFFVLVLLISLVLTIHQKIAIDVDLEQRALTVSISPLTCETFLLRPHSLRTEPFDRCI